MLKRIGKFILFKVLEAGAVLGIPTLIGRMAFNFPGFIASLASPSPAFPCTFWSCFGVGIVVIMLIFIAIAGSIIVIGGTMLLVRKNWEWAGN